MKKKERFGTQSFQFFGHLFQSSSFLLFLRVGFNPINGSYQTTASNLKGFEAIEALPAPLKLRCQKYKDPDQLSKAFLDNRALFHKDCVSAFNKTKLNRKRKHCETVEAEENVKTPISNESIDIRSSRSAVDLQNNSEQCFFCAKEHRQQRLHQCESYSVHQKVSRIADELNDARIIAKLSEGDMLATKAKYHTNCLVSYYNKLKRFQSNQSGEDSFGTLNVIKGIVIIQKSLLYSLIYQF